MQTNDIVPHHSVKDVGRKPFHLEAIDMGKDTAQLHIIVSIDNAPERWIVDYEDIPEDFLPVIREMAKGCPFHMVGFEDGLLADARTVWGYVCPCNLEEGN